MRKDRGHNILMLKFLADEVGRTIDFNFSLRVHLTGKGDPSLGDGEMEIAFEIFVVIQVKPLWQMSQRTPALVPKHPRKSGAILLLGQTPMRLLIMVIPQESLIGSFQRPQGRALMPVQDSFLPEAIKTLHRGIPPGLSLGDEDQMDPQEQMETDGLGEAVRITSSPDGCHLVIHLGNVRNPHRAPGFHQMSAKRNRLFICKLTAKSRMPDHIDGLKGIEARNPVGTPEISGSHNIGLLEGAHFLCLHVWIKLTMVIVLGLPPTRFSITKEDAVDRREGGDIANLALLKFPLDNFGPLSSKGRAPTLVGFQLCPDRENLLHQTFRSFSPDLLGSTTLVLETLWAFFFIPAEPFAEPKATSLDQSENFVKLDPLFVKSDSLTPSLIFIVILHRPFLSHNFCGDFRRCRI